MLRQGIRRSPCSSHRADLDPRSQHPEPLYDLPLLTAFERMLEFFIGDTLQIQSAQKLGTVEWHRANAAVSSRQKSAERTFGNAFRCRKLTLIARHPMDGTEQEVFTYDWGEVDDAKESIGEMSSASLAEFLFLHHKTIPDRAGLERLKGRQLFLNRQEFDLWLRSLKPPKASNDETILCKHDKLRKLMKQHDLRWPHSNFTVSQMAKKVLELDRKMSAADKIGWGDTVLREVLGGRHGSSRRLVEQGQLKAWWSGG
jgi:hypothetical protein